MIICIILTFSLFSSIYTAAITNESQATILAYENTNDGHGNYRFRYVTSNDIEREETGTLVSPGQPEEHIVVEGYYSYLRPDGEREYIRYTADENGFKLSPAITAAAEGVSLPGPVVASLLGK